MPGRTVITMKSLDRAGATVVGAGATEQEDAASGMKFLNSGAHVIVIVRNGHATLAKLVTIQVANPPDSLSITPPTVSVPALGVAFLTIPDKTLYNQADGYVYLDLESSDLHLQAFEPK